MSWRDELFSASFRGEPFYVKSVSTEVGRRSVVHEVPFNDTPYPEDFGKASGVYNITGYVIQQPGNEFNYIPERDALIAALTKEGAGRLVHPFYGEIDVVLSGKARFEETFDEGGIAKFTATFIEAGRVSYPVSTLNPPSSIEAIADGLISDAGDFFTSVYDVEGPNFLSGPLGALGDLQKGLQKVQTGLYKVQTTAVAEVSKVLSTVGAIRTSIGAIIDSPADIVSALVNTFLAYRGLLPFLSTAKQGETAVLAALELLGYGDDLDYIPATTTTRIQQQSNRDAIVAMFRVCGFAEAINFAANIGYESYDQAYDMMVNLVDASDDLLSWLAGKGNDELFDSVLESKPSFVSALLTLGASLPQIRHFPVPPAVYPSLLVAHRVHNDLDREQEIIDRNKMLMLNPGFPDGGAELEVLSE